MCATFFRFPNRNKKKELYEQWVKNCGRLVEPSATSCICSAHFEDKDFNRTLQNTQIREDAIPTLFDPPAHLTVIFEKFHVNMINVEKV